MLTKVISGGQTGVDLGALLAAEEHGIKTGGWMPLGFMAQDGKHPEYSDRFGIQEHISKRYQPRTALNVKESDGTLRIAVHFSSPGEILTYRMIGQYKKPSIDVDAMVDDTLPFQVAEWIEKHNIETLNVAGNSERTCPGIRELQQHSFMRYSKNV